MRGKRINKIYEKERAEIVLKLNDQSFDKMRQNLKQTIDAGIFIQYMFRKIQREREKERLR